MDAPAAYQALNGVFCIYKPAQQAVQMVLRHLRVKLSKELNSMPCRPPRQIVKFVNEYDGNTNSSVPIVTTVPDLADHPLVVGPRYLEKDIDVQAVNKLSRLASGVMVVTIGEGRRVIKRLREAQHMKVYHVKGQFGRATADFSIDGRLIEKTTFHHIRRHHIDKVVAAMQAGHHKNMFHAAGVNVQSQEAYELVSKGMLRPQDSRTGPTIFGMKCVDFSSPEFTLEIHAINEKAIYLMKLVHNIGLELKSSAVCSKIRRIRDGHFTLIHALLQKHWDVNSVIENIEFCHPLLHHSKTVRTPLFERVEKEEPELLPPGESDEFLEEQYAGDSDEFLEEEDVGIK